MSLCKIARSTLGRLYPGHQIALKKECQLPANLTVTGSMNDLINHASAMLVEGELSPFDVGFKLNDVLLSAIAPSKADKYGKPREVFKTLVRGI